jgi:hypothetical protein
MYSLKEWYHLEYNRLQEYSVDLSKILKICTDMVSQPFSSQHEIQSDLFRAYFHPSLSYNHYCRQWLNYQGKSYLQGMHNGQLPLIATNQFFCVLLENEDNVKIPYKILSFAYQDDQGRMSTFLVYVEPNQNYWTIAVCHDPLQAPAHLRFDIICSLEDYTDEDLKRVIAHEEISELLIEFIQEKLQDPQNLDPIEIKKEAITAFRLRHGTAEKEPPKAARTYTTIELNKKLWGELAYTPTELYEKTLEERIDEINRDFQRTLVHPSLPIDKRQQVLELWGTKNCPYYQGLIAGSHLSKTILAGEKIYDIKFCFIYQTDTGNYASFYFYMDILNHKCFLSCCDDPIQAYNQQAFECLFPLEKMPTQTEVQDVVKNEELSKLTMHLLTQLPQFSALQYTNPDELQAKTKLLHQCLRSEFDLETYHVDDNEYQAVPPPPQSYDDILPKLDFNYYLKLSGIYMLDLLIAIWRAIINGINTICSCFSYQSASVAPEPSTTTPNF